MKLDDIGTVVVILFLWFLLIVITIGFVKIAKIIWNFI